MVRRPSRVKRLNREQLQAVKHKKGPLLIIAGAGTGKTTVVTERIKRLILSKQALASEILALTFTEKAAREMEERVDLGMPYGYTQMWISTFHSFCDRVLRQEVLQIGLDPGYRLMSQSETIQFLRNNLFKFDLDYFRPLGNPTKFVDGMLQHFSRLQDEDVSPSQYLKWLKTQKAKRKKGKKGKEREKTKTEERQENNKWQELSRAYQTYDDLKTKQGLMDFGDLVVKTLSLFRERRNVLKEYREKFKYVLVDEYQDTNIAQNELVKLLAGRNGNVCVVADDDQSVYKWRGAAVSNVVQFRKSFPQTKVITLTKNYRSAQEILDKAYDLIQFNNPDRLEKVEKIDKKLKAQKDIQGKIVFIHSDRVENEAEETAKKIKDLIEKQKYDPREIAILVRANNHFEPFARSLGRQGIDYQFLGPGKLFKQPEIVDFISYLKVLYDFEDSIALLRLLSLDHFDINFKDLIKLGNFAKRYDISLFETCEKIDRIAVQDVSKKKIKALLSIIEKHLKLVKKETAGRLLYLFLEETKLLSKLLNPDTPEAERRAVNISKFFDKLKTYEINHEDATVLTVVDWLELASELGESPLAADSDWTEVNAVNILTIHSAKGLEFPVVFLVNLVSQRFPTIQRREQIPIPEDLIKEILPSGDHHIQEERRLFYVGMTRAMERLYLTAADYYGEAKREKRLSPFIFEALGDEAVSSEQNAKAKQISFLEHEQKRGKIKKTFSQPIPVQIDFLSYSQIQTFKICPLHYKLRYIFKIPTPPSPALSFGSSVHETMKDFYEAIDSKQKPSNRMLIKLFEKNWIAEGYRNKSHEKKMFEKGKKHLREYLKKEFNSKVKTVAVENPFVIPLDPIGIEGNGKKERRLKVGGKIDRVDRLANGRIEIIDYKTGGNVPTQSQVDKDFQLTLYALAAANIKEPPFNKKPKDILLSLYFFEGQQKITTTRTAEQIMGAKNEIFEWRRKIEESDFKCSRNFLCRNCEYQLMCGAGN